MAKTEGRSKSAKRKIEEVEEDADEGKQNSIKRFFRAPKEGKRRLTCFALVFFSFLSILPGPLAPAFGFVSDSSLA